MHEMTISMGTIARVKRFVDIVSEYKEDVNLVLDDYSIDAKSIMGIFSMDLTMPLLLKVKNTSDQRFQEIAQELHEYAV